MKEYISKPFSKGSRVTSLVGINGISNLEQLGFLYQHNLIQVLYYLLPNPKISQELSQLFYNNHEKTWQIVKICTKYNRLNHSRLSNFVLGEAIYGEA